MRLDADDRDCDRGRAAAVRLVPVLVARLVPAVLVRFEPPLVPRVEPLLLARVEPLLLARVEPLLLARVEPLLLARLPFELARFGLDRFEAAALLLVDLVVCAISLLVRVDVSAAGAATQ